MSKILKLFQKKKSKDKNEDNNHDSISGQIYILPNVIVIRILQSYVNDYSNIVTIRNWLLVISSLCKEYNLKILSKVIGKVKFIVYNECDYYYYTVMKARGLVFYKLELDYNYYEKQNRRNKKFFSKEFFKSIDKLINCHHVHISADDRSKLLRDSVVRKFRLLNSFSESDSSEPLLDRSIDEAIKSSEIKFHYFFTNLLPIFEWLFSSGIKKLSIIGFSDLKEIYASPTVEFSSRLKEMKSLVKLKFICIPVYINSNILIKDIAMVKTLKVLILHFDYGIVNINYLKGKVLSEALLSPDSPELEVLKLHHGLSINNTDKEVYVSNSLKYLSLPSIRHIPNFDSNYSINRLDIWSRNEVTLIQFNVFMSLRHLSLKCKSFSNENLLREYISSDQCNLLSLNLFYEFNDNNQFISLLDSLLQNSTLKSLNLESMDMDLDLYSYFLNLNHPTIEHFVLGHFNENNENDLDLKFHRFQQSIINNHTIKHLESVSGDFKSQYILNFLSSSSHIETFKTCNHNYDKGIRQLPFKIPKNHATLISITPDRDKKRTTYKDYLINLEKQQYNSDSLFLESKF